MTPKFRIGQQVRAIAFTDCFGNRVPERAGLVVMAVRLIEPAANDRSMKPYYRIEAYELYGRGGYVIEGAERFFAADLTLLTITALDDTGDPQGKWAGNRHRIVLKEETPDTFVGWPDPTDPRNSDQHRPGVDKPMTWPKFAWKVIETV